MFMFYFSVLNLDRLIGVSSLHLIAKTLMICSRYFILGLFAFISHRDMHVIMFPCDQLRISSTGASNLRQELWHRPK